MEVVPPGLSWLAVVAKPTARNSEPRMDSHEKARTTPRGRTLIVQGLAAGQSVGDVAAAEGASRPAFTAMMHDEKKRRARWPSLKPPSLGSRPMASLSSAS